MIYPIGSIIEEWSLGHAPRYFKIINHFYRNGQSADGTYTLDAVGDTRYKIKMQMMNDRNPDGTPRLSLAQVCRMYMGAQQLEKYVTRLILQGGKQYWQNYRLRHYVRVIDRFRGQYSFLSNFSLSRIGPFPHGEAAFQSCKCADPDDAKKFMEPGLKPAAARLMGRKVKLIPHWEENKAGYMRDVVHAKFRDPRLRRMLIDTEDTVLIEGNSHRDTFWGVYEGKGKNVLGMLLMEERALICANQSWN